MRTRPKLYTTNHFLDLRAFLAVKNQLKNADIKVKNLALTGTNENKSDKMIEMIWHGRPPT